MVKSFVPKEKWAEVAPAYIKEKKQYYYLRINPIESEGYVSSIQTVLDHIPTEEDKAALYSEWLSVVVGCKKISAAEHYDSQEVKSFLLNGTPTWIPTENRDRLLLSLPREKAAGRTTTALYIEGVCYVAEIDKVLAMLDEVEVYAVDCRLALEQHKQNIGHLETIEEVEAYDYTANYPERVSIVL